MRSTILIVEDDKEIRRLIEEILLDNDYSVITAADGVAALNLAQKKRPDLVLVDLGLPKLSGESVCLALRKKYPQLPLIILTAKSDVSDVLRGFDLGVDDYIAKPFDLDILLARIKARLRIQADQSEILKVDDLTLNNRTFEVRRSKRNIVLSQKEFQLLQYLMANKGTVLTRDMILQKIWLSSDYIEPRVVDVYIGYLRKKIDSGFPKKLLRTMRGFGYTIKN